MSFPSFDLPVHLQGRTLLHSLDSKDSAEALDFIITMIEQGQFIHAIKAARNVSSSSLKGSKDFCEMLRDRIAVAPPASRREIQALRDEIDDLRLENQQLKRAANNRATAAPSAKNGFDQLVGADLVRQTFEANYNVVAGGLNIFGVTLRKLLEDLLLAVSTDDSKEQKNTAKQWRDWFLARIGMAASAITAFNEIIALFQDMGLAVAGRTPDVNPARSKPFKDAKREAEMRRRHEIEQDWHRRLEAEAQARRVDPFDTGGSSAKSPFGFQKH